MKKFLFGFFLAFSIFFVPRSVSAASSVNYSFNYSGSVSFVSSSSYPFDINYSTSANKVLSISFSRNSDNWLIFFTDSYFSNNSEVVININYSNNNISVSFFDSNSVSLYFSYYAFKNGNYNSSQSHTTSFNWSDVILNNVYANSDFIIDPVFSPEFDVVPLPFFSLDIDSFYDWIISNNKLSELPAYLVQSKLKSFLDFYKQFGSSNAFFISKIPLWFAHMNIANQSISNISSLKSAIDKLYEEYINYRSGTHAYWPGATKLQERDSIDTVTDNNNTTLITDDANDDIYTKLLRDILRAVISISNNVVQGCSDIVNKLDLLNFNVNVANNGGLSSATDLTPVLNKLDAIIEALGADTVSVEIDQTTKDDTDDFFDDWNLQFTTALNNKFPVASQLNQFFTGFFERCGIDADSDGEVYQYYNPGVLTASSVSRSAGTASEEDIVSDFLGQFDNSDPAFLDDASFHGVPDLSVSVCGHSVSIIDFRVYAKYRDKIHFIISFVIWTLYLLHLYKALPQIIGQVADVAVKTSDL